jgi:hypothetical protein
MTPSPSHRRVSRARTISLFGFGALCAAAAACVATTPISPSEDAGGFDSGLENNDGSVPEAGKVGAPDAAPDHHDAGGLDTGVVDTGVADHATADHDAGEPDAADGQVIDAHVDSPPDATPDTGPTCAEILAAAYAAPIVPPNKYLGLNLAADGFDGGYGSGGLTIEQTGLLACASSFTAADAGDPASTVGDLAVFNDLADGGSSVAQLQFNVQSHVLSFEWLMAGYTGQLHFNSRVGGAYGPHTYVVSIMGPGDAGSTGEVLRDGVPFAADWNFVALDGGGQAASAWANELYDGLMATFAPTVPAVSDCYTATSPDLMNDGLPVVGVDCLFLANNGGGSELGIRPLDLYLDFVSNSNQVIDIYAFWQGGQASCATPEAAVDSTVNAGLFPAYLPSIFGFYLQIGNVIPERGISNPNGLTYSELQTAWGCGGSSWTPPDPGYGGMQWANGAVAAEYNLDSGVNYKVYAQSGYRGGMSFYPADGGTYYLTVGSPTPTIDWTSAATANPAITAIANDYYYTNCTAPADTDCVAAGDCSIVVNDGSGHSTFTLSPGTNLVNNYCGTMQAVTFVLAQGTSVPEQIYATNPGGQ